MSSTYYCIKRLLNLNLMIKIHTSLFARSVISIHHFYSSKASFIWSRSIRRSEKDLAGPITFSQTIHPYQNKPISMRYKIWLPFSHKLKPRDRVSAFVRTSTKITQNSTMIRQKCNWCLTDVHVMSKILTNPNFLRSL